MNAKINIQELNSLLAEKSGLTPAEAETFVRAFFDLLTENLIKEKLVKIKSLGTFKLSAVEDRESIDVRTGERVLIPAHEKISFVPEKHLSETINEPFALFEPVEIEALPEEKPAKNEEPAIIEEPSTKEEPDPIVEESVVPTEEQKDSKDKDGGSNDSKSSDDSSRINEIEHPENIDISRNQKRRRKRQSSRKPLVQLLLVLSVLLLICLTAYYIYLQPNKATAPILPKIAEQQVYEEPKDVIEETETVIEETETTVTATATKPVEVTTPIKKRTIADGERLTLIALEEYGSKAFWVYLYEENKDIIQKPDNVSVGTVIVIPPASKYGIDKNDPESISRALKLAQDM